jgi:hypothetical protein
MSRRVKRRPQKTGFNGICPKCLTLKPLTKHHVLPKRHFGCGDRSPILFLCRECHDLIELLIPFERRKPAFYFAVAISFVQGKLEPIRR